MTISKEDKFIGSCLIGVVLLIVCSSLWSSYTSNRLVKETQLRTTAEEKIKKLAKEFQVRKLEIDSLKQDKVKLETVLEYQRNNPQVIINKYEQVHKDIDALDNTRAFLLFSTNAYKYREHRERYNINRFKRND